MSRILLVEDNADLAFGLRHNLALEGYDVEVAADGRAGLDRVRDAPPDLVVLDLMLPGLDGFRLLRELRRHDRTTPVLVLTARGEEDDKVRGLRLGADDYVTKPFGLRELLARVEALLRRAAGAVPDRLVLGDVTVDPAARVVLRAGAPVHLAPKELELLLALARRVGAAVSRGDLLREVWRYDASVRSRTVDTHVAALRRKLEADPAAPRHLVTVPKVGYRLQR